MLGICLGAQLLAMAAGGNQAAPLCCIGMAIASNCRLMQPCWVRRCTVRNGCFGSEPTPLACNATSRSTVSALGAEGPDRLTQDWRRLGTTLQEQGRNFLNAVLDQLIEISHAH